MRVSHQHISNGQLKKLKKSFAFDNDRKMGTRASYKIDKSLKTSSKYKKSELNNSNIRNSFERSDERTQSRMNKSPNGEKFVGH